MTADEARSVVRRINHHLSSARDLLLDLYQREGWRALGYGSWEECVKEEFGKSRSYLYRQLAAGRLEKALSLPVGDSPESHMRPLIEILDDDADRERAYFSATNNGSVTAESFRKAAWETWVLSNMKGSVIAARLEAGEVGAKQAFLIGKMCQNGSNVIQMCNDPELARALLEVKENRKALWEEIDRTLCIPTIDGQIPLPDATYANLRAYLVIDSAEHRARHVENNRAYYDKVGEIEEEIIDRAETLSVMVMNNDDAKPHAWELLQLIEELNRVKEKRDGSRPDGTGPQNGRSNPPGDS